MSSSQRKRRQTTLAFWAFVGPMFIGLIVFTYIPIIWGLLLSFFEARRTVTSTTQYNGGCGGPIQTTELIPKRLRIWFARPNGRPFKIFNFQTIEATT